MMMKKQQSKEDCNESSEDSEIVYVLTEKTTSSDILSVGQPVSWYVYVIKLPQKSISEHLIFIIFLKGMSQDSLALMLYTMSLHHLH